MYLPSFSAHSYIFCAKFTINLYNMSQHGIEKTSNSMISFKSNKVHDISMYTVVEVKMSLLQH